MPDCLDLRYEAILGRMGSQSELHLGVPSVLFRAVLSVFINSPVNSGNHVAGYDRFNISDKINQHYRDTRRSNAIIQFLSYCEKCKLRIKSNKIDHKNAEK